MKYYFKEFVEENINALSNIVLAELNEEKIYIPYLPNDEEYIEKIEKMILEVFKNGNGIVIWKENEIMGFISGYEVEELFGKNKGIYVPLYGHGTKKENRDEIYKELYKYIAEKWVKNRCYTHAITMFAHDKKNIETWFWQGFGMRCVDAIKKVEKIELKNNDIKIIKAEIPDLIDRDEIYKEHISFLKESPIFMKIDEENTLEKITDWLTEKNKHLWIAYKNGKAVGYMQIEESGESFISESKNMMNITGAHVIEGERKSGIATALLSNIQEWLMINGYNLCGVEYESINIYGSKFWNKQFKPYTFSLVRRIDERINAD